MEAEGEAYVLVTVLGTKVQHPRDMGTKMVFGAESSFGTIGGGHLEYRANMIAARLLAEQKQSQRIETFPLGPSLGQCCGGRVNLLFECFMPTKLQVMLLVPVMSVNPWRLCSLAFLWCCIGLILAWLN
ncbi:MAG: hypothetical protein CM15mP84_04730 [Cellvibrionales bacterium]|nr:MAG: hypothetical protein CM15mP84_04730 [Cellvibrionales bacterium]